MQIKFGKNKINGISILIYSLHCVAFGGFLESASRLLTALKLRDILDQLWNPGVDWRDTAQSLGPSLDDTQRQLLDLIVEAATGIDDGLRELVVQVTDRWVYSGFFQAGLWAIAVLISLLILFKSGSNRS